MLSLCIVKTRVKEPQRLKAYAPKFFQIPVYKVRNFKFERFSKKSGSFLSREDQFSMYTEQDKTFCYELLPIIIYSYIFYKKILALVHKMEALSCGFLL